MKKRTLLLPLIAVVAVASLGSMANAQVIYRETFGRPDPPAGTGNLSTTNWDWARFNADGTFQTNNSGVNGADSGVVTDPLVANTVTAGPHNDDTFTPYVRGWSFLDGTQRVTMTTEYAFDPAALGQIKFSWHQGHAAIGGVDQAWHVAIRQGGTWYASVPTFTNPAVGGGNLFGAQAVPRELLYNPAASNWLTLNFDGDYDPETNMGTGSTLGAIALGPVATSNLSGQITAFGFYRDATGANARFDNFEIEVVGVPGDVNGDEVANILDFNIIRDNFQQAGTKAQGDLTGDGFVNLLDFRIWKDNRTAGAGAALGADAVPEPGSIALALFGAIALWTQFGRGRRRG